MTPPGKILYFKRKAFVTIEEHFSLANFTNLSANNGLYAYFAAKNHRRYPPPPPETGHVTTALNLHTENTDNNDDTCYNSQDNDDWHDSQ